MRILSVGSTVIDLFLSPHVEGQTSEILKLKLGTKIPTDFKSTSIGGNAANVAVVLTKLGIDAPLYTYLAKDFFAKEIEIGLEKEKVSLISEKIKGKSDFSLILTVGQERIIFSHHDKADHSFNFNRVPPDTIYLTSIGQRWTDAYSKVTAYSKNNHISLALSPGSQQIASLNDEFYNTLKSSHYFFSNKEEAQKVAKVDSDNIHEIVHALHDLGPQVVSITQGAQGAFASDRNDLLQIDVIQDSYAEKTGAGDAYAATFLGWYTHKNDLKEAMRAATINASAVMKKVGAHEGILTKDQLETKLQEHSNLQPKNI